MTRISRWFLEITLDSETLRWCNGRDSLTLDDNTYTPLGTRWTPPDRLKRRAGLKSEKFELDFDSSRQSDNTDPVGALLDKTWRRRQIRLRRIVWNSGQVPDDGTVLEDERGRLRNLSDSLKAGQAARLTMEIESGALAYLERRMETRTPASQNAAYPGDKGFDLIAQLEGVTLPWRTKFKKSGTVQLELQEEYEPYPRELALGRFVTSGSFVAAFTNGQQRKYMQRVYAIADHKINKLDKVWINGYQVRNSALTHGVRTLVYLEGNSEQRCWITFHQGGHGQTADAYLQAAASEWTADHRLRGVAYVVIEHLWDSDLPESFDYRFSGEGALLYDRRKDSTAGGSGSHRWSNPTTWEYSTNAMVAADHYRSGIRVTFDSDVMWFGVGEAVDAVPYAEFKALADLCDQNVALKGGGTQKRYEVNGILSAAESHDKNLQRLADQMAARAIDQGGRISFRPPIVRTPVITLTDDDMVRDSESRADPGGGLDDMLNGIEGRFINPANDYKKDDYPRVQIAAYIGDDNGEITDTLNLDLEINAERCQRIAKLKIEDSRRIFYLEETYKTAARVIEPGEWYVRKSVIRGFPSGKTFVAEEVERFIDGSIRVRGSEVYPDELVWDETTAVDLSVPPAFPSTNRDALANPDVTITPGQVGDSGDVTWPGLKLEFDYGTDPVPSETQIEVARDDGTGQPDYSYEVQAETVPAGAAYVWLSSILQPGVNYVIRVRSVYDGRHSEWSDWVQFTATSEFTSKSSLYAEQLSAEALAALNTLVNDLVDAEAEARETADDLLSQGLGIAQQAGYTNWYRDPLITLGTLEGYGSNGLPLYMLTGATYRSAGVERDSGADGQEMILYLPGNHPIQPGARGQASVTIEEVLNTAALELRAYYYDDAGDPVTPAFHAVASGASGRIGGFFGLDGTDAGAIPAGTASCKIAVRTIADGTGDARFAVSQMLGAFAGLNDTALAEFVDPADEQVARQLDYAVTDIQNSYQLRGLSWEQGEARSEITRLDTVQQDQASTLTTLQTSYGEVSANATFRMVTGYTPSAGWDARIGLQARVSTGSVYRDGGLYLEVTESASRLILNADQVAITDGDNVSALFQSGTTYLNAAIIQSLSADKISAGIIRNFDNSMQIDLQNYRIHFDNGSIMKVDGLGFGTSNQFIEWVGPSKAISLCDEASAIRYVKTNGDAYFGGSLSAGVLNTSISTSSIAQYPTVETPVFGSNGNIISVTSGFNSVYAESAYQPTPPGVPIGSEIDSGSAPCQIKLYRSVAGGAYSLVATYDGTWEWSRTFVEYDPSDGYLVSSDGAVSISATYTDSLEVASDRQFKLEVSVRGYGGSPFTQNYQRLSIVCVEE